MPIRSSTQGLRPGANNHLRNIAVVAVNFQSPPRGQSANQRIAPVNVLPRELQIQIVGHLVEGASIRSVERLTGVHRDTIMRLGARVGNGCARLHDFRMVGVRAGRIELDEAWSYVGKKQKRVKPAEHGAKGDAYVFVALAATSKAIISYRVGLRNGATTEDFIFDIRERVIGNPEISTDAWSPYQPAIRAVFGPKAIYGQINKTYQVTDLRRSPAHRYSPAEVVAVERRVVSGIPGHISTSYVERQHLSLRMSQRRFSRLTNAFSKKMEHHVAAMGLYVAHYNFCRVHEAHKQTPAMMLGIAGHVWSIGELLEQVLKGAPFIPAPKRPRLQVIVGGIK